MDQTSFIVLIFIATVWIIGYSLMAIAYILNKIDEHLKMCGKTGIL